MSDGPPHARAPLLDGANRAFVLRRLHSLSGVVPVGAFLCVHLWTNASAMGGRASFDHAVREIHALPWLPVIEIALIFLPLAFHAGYGVKLAFEGRANVGRYPYTRNWMYSAQRVTGLVTFVFILYHLWELRIQKLLGAMSPDAFYPTLEAKLSSTYGGVPLVALAYLAGIGAAVFHLANGLWGFCASWGITTSRRSQRAAGWVLAVLGAGLFFVGADTTLYFATGARFLLPVGSGATIDGEDCDVSAPAPAPPAPPATTR